jgi:hypothetical protein
MRVVDGQHVSSGAAPLSPAPIDDRTVTTRTTATVSRQANQGTTTLYENVAMMVNGPA